MSGPRRRTILARPRFGPLVGGLVPWVLSLWPTMLPRVVVVQGVVSGVCRRRRVAASASSSATSSTALAAVGRSPPSAVVRHGRGGWSRGARPSACSRPRRVAALAGRAARVMGMAEVGFGTGLVVARRVARRAGRPRARRPLVVAARALDRPARDPARATRVIGRIAIGDRRSSSCSSLVGSCRPAKLRGRGPTPPSATVNEGDTGRGLGTDGAGRCRASPGSLVPWDTLGYQGRRVHRRRAAVDDIAAFTGSRDGVVEPIRAYVGLDSAAPTVERARRPARAGARAHRRLRARRARRRRPRRARGGSTRTRRAPSRSCARRHGDRRPCSTRSCRAGSRSWSTRRTPPRPARACSGAVHATLARLTRRPTGHGSWSRREPRLVRCRVGVLGRRRRRVARRPDGRRRRRPVRRSEGRATRSTARSSTGVTPARRRGAPSSPARRRFASPTTSGDVPGGDDGWATPASCTCTTRPTRRHVVAGHDLAPARLDRAPARAGVPGRRRGSPSSRGSRRPPT